MSTSLATGRSGSLATGRSGYRAANELASAAVMASLVFSVTSAAQAESGTIPRASGARPVTGAEQARTVVTGEQVRNLPNVRRTDRTSFKLGKTDPKYPRPATLAKGKALGERRGRDA